MKQSQFIGWVKKAYPNINIQKQDNGDIWLSDSRYLQVIARTDNIIEFRKLRNSELPGPMLVEDDVEIVNNIRGLWGDPGVAFSLPQPHKTEVEKGKEESKPEPRHKQPENKEAQDRDSVIELLKNTFPETIEVVKVPGGKAVKVGGSKLTLYDYGISSRPSEFIPWARKEEVTQCVTKFISLNK